MQGFFDRLDGLAGIGENDRTTVWLERAAFIFMTLMVAAAPHSIAATQTAWIIGMLTWVIRLFRAPRVKLLFGPLDAALWGLFFWSVISSVASYAPDISIDKLRGAAVFLIFYFVFYNLRNARAVRFLGILLIVSCMVNVLWMPVERAIGRGIEIHGLDPNGPLAKALLWEGDTLLTANNAKLRTPEDAVSAIEQGETTKVKFYRPDFDFTVEVKRADLLPGNSALERLGITSWKKSRNWRSSGFYGHYTTYAEVLQLIASLVLGLLAAWFGGRRETHLAVPAALGLALAAMCLALLLTVTRAPQLGFLISAAVIVLLGLGRKWFLIAAAVAVPLAFAGLLFLQQSREVGFFDPEDDSIKWRQTVWREGVSLWTDSPRNFVFGVGMDSIKRYAGEWHLFDDGRLNMGHFHSTPLQMLVERGLPALILWLLFLGVYAGILWRGYLSADRLQANFVDRGIILGCLGGLAGFVASSLVHYNYGDQEVAMVFFILMAFGVKLSSIEAEPETGRLQQQKASRAGRLF